MTAPVTDRSMQTLHELLLAEPSQRSADGRTTPPTLRPDRPPGGIGGDERGERARLRALRLGPESLVPSQDETQKTGRARRPWTGAAPATPGRGGAAMRAASRISSGFRNTVQPPHDGQVAERTHPEPKREARSPRYGRHVWARGPGRGITGRNIHMRTPRVPAAEEGIEYPPARRGQPTTGATLVRAVLCVVE